MVFGSGTSTGFNSGLSAPKSSGFSFGSSNATTTGASLTTNQVTTPATGFSFGATTSNVTSNTPSVLGTSFGQKSTTSAGLFGTTTTSVGASSTSNAGSNLLSQNSSKPAFKGLGGVNLSTSTGSSADNTDKNGVISQVVKDQTVPEEICKDVKQFEDYVSKQKQESNEVAKFSVRSLYKIHEEISNLSFSLSAISSAVQRNKAAVEKLRSEFGAEIKNVEMAQRTQNTPAALQHDNIAPLRYFAELVSNFDSSMQIYRQQIDELENHLHSLSQTNLLSPQDISMALMKMQETFVTLASNLHSIHDNIKHLKDQYLAYRRIVHGDPTDIFAVHKENKAKERKQMRVEGLPPLQNLSNVAALAMATMLQQPQQSTQPTPPQQSFLKPSFGTTATGNPFGTNSTTSGLFGTKPAAAATNSLFASTTSSGFGGFGATSNPLKPTLSAGFNKPSTSSNVFFGNSTFNSSAGVTFGGSAGRPDGFNLKLPAVGSKRNKKSA